MPTFRPVSSHSDAAIDFRSGNKLVSQQKVNHLFLRVCATKKTGLAYECALFNAFGDEHGWIETTELTAQTQAWGRAPSEESKFV